ncbi:MAG: NAD(P)-dependent oxidoreductase [Bacteroidia bacterium]
MITLGLIREFKQPADRRVAFNPQQCAEIKKQFSEIDIAVESSPDRIFTDNAYKKEGISVSDDLSDCDILFGIKEIPIEKLLANKTYLFFSHTIKKQPHNCEMLKAIINKKIRLIDYECLVRSNGIRVLGFGRYAGLVGTYETLRALGLKNRTFKIKPAYECADYEEMLVVLGSIVNILKVGKHKIVITGSGRVSSGVEELLTDLKIKKVTPDEFLNQTFDEIVYTLLDINDLYERKDGSPWNHDHFFNNHSAYQSKFKPYCSVATILINGVFWDSAMPQHFSKEDTKSNDFSIKVIGDISCDVEGSVPITIHDTHAENPVFGWDAANQCECEPFTEKSIDVMAVSNLPSELPANASEGFGNDLLKFVLPELLKPESEMIKNATICQNGNLTEKFNYLADYIL